MTKEFWFHKDKCVSHFSSCRNPSQIKNKMDTEEILRMYFLLINVIYKLYPTVSEPTGRMSFNVLDPLGFIKDIIGPDLYNKCFTTICSILCIAILFVVGYSIVT